MASACRSSVFCHYITCPKILDKSGKIPVVDKSNCSELTIKTPDSFNDSFIKQIYLTKCGRYLIFTQCWPSGGMNTKVLIVERCNSKPSHVIPIHELKIDIYPYAMYVSPNEENVVIYEAYIESSTETILVFNLYKLSVCSGKPNLVMIDKMTIKLDEEFLPNVFLTNSEFLVLFGEHHFSTYDISKKFSLTQEHNGIGFKMSCQSLLVDTQSNSLSVHFPSLRTGKSRRKILDGHWQGYEGGTLHIQIHPYHLQDKAGILYAIISCAPVYDSKVYIIEIVGSKLNVLKTVCLMDVVKEVLPNDLNDINDEEKSWDILCMSVNPYTCDCYALLVEDDFQIDIEPTTNRQRLFCFNLFSSGRKHIIDISDIQAFDPKMLVNWTSNELLIIDAHGKIFGFQLPLSNSSLQSLTKRAILTLYKPQEIVNLDIPRYLKEYILY